MVDRGTILFLYRSILRLHQRHLPEDMRALGDAYVRSEFKLHKNVTNEKQKLQFFQGWMYYLTTIKNNVEVQVEKNPNVNQVVTNDEESAEEPLKKFGSHLPPDLELSDDQRNNLQKLKQEAYNLSNNKSRS